MTPDARVEALLEGLSREERLAGKPPKAWTSVLGVSLPGVYRLVADGKLGYVKLESKPRRNGRGRAGGVRINWCHVAAFLAERWVDAADEGRS